MIDKGLKPGETVVTEGQLRLEQGTRVQPTDTGGAPGAGGGRGRGGRGRGQGGQGRGEAPRGGSVAQGARPASRTVEHT